MTPTSQPTVQPRGTCAYCKRSMAVLSDGLIARPHRGEDGRPCLGHGRPALPEVADVRP